MQEFAKKFKKKLYFFESRPPQRNSWASWKGPLPNLLKSYEDKSLLYCPCISCITLYMSIHYYFHYGTGNFIVKMNKMFHFLFHWITFFFIIIYVTWLAFICTFKLSPRKISLLFPIMSTHDVYTKLMIVLQKQYVCILGLKYVWLHCFLLQEKKEMERKFWFQFHAPELKAVKIYFSLNSNNL